jgi:hypothetical protein
MTILCAVLAGLGDVRHVEGATETLNVYFVDDEGVEWEERSFSVYGAKWGADRPPLPLLQPEKVLSLPLQLRFDGGYRYQLGGTERVDGYDCHVVRFEPVRSGAALYRGTVWIDRKTFARIRVHGTIIRAELGEAVLPVQYQGLGSTTWQILVLKPLR